MSVTNVIPLFPERKPVVQQEAVIAAHRPCPDLSSYSLNQEQKERGLENLAKARQQVKDYLLQPLREQCRELKAEARRALTEEQEVEAINQIKVLEKKAKRINQCLPTPSNPSH